VTPAEDTIPRGVRGALLNWFESRGRASPTAIWAHLNQQEGWGSFQDVCNDIADRIGSSEAQAFEQAASKIVAATSRIPVGVSGLDRNARPALLAIPDPFFLDALAIAVRLEQTYDSYAPSAPSAR